MTNTNITIANVPTISFSIFENLCVNGWPLVLEATFFPLHSVLVGHGYLQHAGAEFLGLVNLRYHVYLSLEDLYLQKLISNAYQWTLKAVNEDTAKDESVQGDHVSVLSTVPEDQLL